MIEPETLRETLKFRTFTKDKRDQLAKAGKAMPDGSFPIENCSDVSNAVRLAGHGSNPGAAKRHIMKRAKALGCTNIPDSWKGGSTAKGSESLAMLLPAKKFSYDETSDLTWVQAFPYGSWEHPIYGTVKMTPEIASEMKQNFDESVMQQAVPWTFDHGEDKAKGNKAAGTIEQVDIRDDGVWCGLKLTKTALQELADGEWLYVSPEYKEAWTSQVTGETHSNVLWGGSFTNYPFLKGIAPINMSDLVLPEAEVADKEHSEPGTGGGGEPAPKTDNDPIAPPPPMTPPDPNPNVQNKGGDNTVDEAQLRAALEIDENVDIMEHVKGLAQANKSLTLAANELDSAKKFSEQYPEQARRLAELDRKDKENEAKRFSESYMKFGDGKVKVAFAPAAIQKIRETHLKLSDGRITHDEFQGVLDEIAKHGIVTLGEFGSSTTADDHATNPMQAAQRLSEIAREKVADAAKAGNTLTLADATQQASVENPDLVELYRSGVSRPA